MLLASLILASKLAAAGAVPAQDEPLRSSSYVIDLFQGPVLAGSRPTGLGGAIAGVAEGVDGDQVNAAAPAVRLPWSVDWFDYDLTLGVTFPTALRETDFDNNGKSGFFYDQFLFGTLGLNLQFGGWGLGAVLDIQNYQVLGQSPGGARQNLNASLQRGHALLSRRFYGGQLMLGAGLRFAVLSLSANEGLNGKVNELFKTSGATPEAGAIWTPYGLPLAGGGGGAHRRAQRDRLHQPDRGRRRGEHRGRRALPAAAGGAALGGRGGSGRAARSASAQHAVGRPARGRRRVGARD